MENLEKFEGEVFHCSDGGRKRRYGRLKEVDGDRLKFYYGNNPEGYRNFEVDREAFVNSLENGKIWPKKEDLRTEGSSKEFLG